MNKHFDEASLFLPLPKPVVRPGEFVFSAMHLDHAHIIGMCGALRDAGATLKSVYDPDPAKVADFCRSFPGTRPAASEREILDDPEVRMVAADIAQDAAVLFFFKKPGGADTGVQPMGPEALHAQHPPDGSRADQPFRENAAVGMQPFRVIAHILAPRLTDAFPRLL